ncbi:hypothetical protein Pint_04224 [Pistacia integerrima]|uniref:Uncharacterized protein n=1 Tax=Pistacia integerrima TaxID=434235 RepID=A0ACC0Z6R9_9ROSI|nr:hypothetical protein Pint_04224 [Pistacia integerrima]
MVPVAFRPHSEIGGLKKTQAVGRVANSSNSNELQQVDIRCSCQNIEQTARQQRRLAQFRGEEVQELYETASELPRMCYISPSQGCQFRSPD